MRCSKLTCNFASLIFLTIDATAQWQTPGWRMTLEQCCLLPRITIFNGPRCIFGLRTNYNSYLPEPCIYIYIYIYNSQVKQKIYIYINVVVKGTCFSLHPFFFLSFHSGCGKYFNFSDIFAKVVAYSNYVLNDVYCVLTFNLLCATNFRRHI